MNDQPIRILLAEDSPADAELAEREIRKALSVYTLKRVETREDFLSSLKSHQPDLVISDYNMPRFDGMTALNLSLQHEPLTPVIIWTGSMNEDIAVDCMKAGATNYVIKENIKRLGPAIVHALEERQLRLERQRVEESLRESESSYRGLFNSVQEAIYIQAQDGRFLDVNQGAVKMYGHPREWFVDKTPLDVSAPDRNNLEKVMGQAQRAFAGEPQQFEFWGVRANGEVFPKDVRLYKGRYFGQDVIIALAQDITERKKAEEALRKAEARYRGLVERLPLMVYTAELGTEGVWTYISPQIEKMLGFTPQEWMTDSGLWYRQIHPDDRESQQRIEENAYLKGKSYASEYRIFARDGRQVWIRDSAQISPPLRDGDAPMVQGILEDITERKSAQNELHIAEAKYRLLVEQSPAVIYLDMANSNSSNFYISPQIETLTGYPLDKFIENPLLWHEIIFPDDYPIAKESINTTLDQGSAVVEYRLITHDGQVAWVRDSSVLVQMDGNDSGFIQGFIEDISDRKEAEEKIRRQVSHLKALAEIDRAIISSFDLRLNLEILLEQATKELRAGAADVLLYNPDLQILEFIAGRGLDLKSAPQLMHQPFNNSPAKPAILNQKMIHISDLNKQPAFSRHHALAKDGFADYYAVPLIAKGRANGILEVYHQTAFEADEDWLDFLKTLAGQAAIAVDNATLFNELHRSNSDLIRAYDETIEGWSAPLDLRDKETEGHTQRVTDLTMKLARSVGIQEAMLPHIRRGALLHDIGKMGVPDHILLKASSLTEDEWKVMRQHPLYAYKMLSPIEFLRPALDIPRYHHEKWDGSGYPEGLKDEQIPMAARIFSVCDVWDALTSDRPYRKAWTKTKVLKHIQAQSGLHFDPRIVGIFQELITKQE